MGACHPTRISPEQAPVVSREGCQGMQAGPRMGERKAKAGARGGGARDKTVERTEIDLDAPGCDENSRTKKPRAPPPGSRRNCRPRGPSTSCTSARPVQGTAYNLGGIASAGEWLVCAHAGVWVLAGRFRAQVWTRQSGPCKRSPQLHRQVVARGVRATRWAVGAHTFRMVSRALRLRMPSLADATGKTEAHRASKWSRHARCARASGKTSFCGWSSWV